MPQVFFLTGYQGKGGAQKSETRSNLKEQYPEEKKQSGECPGVFAGDPFQGEKKNRISDPPDRKGTYISSNMGLNKATGARLSPIITSQGDS